MREDIYAALEDRVEENDNFKYILIPFNTDEELGDAELKYFSWWK